MTFDFSFDNVGNGLPLDPPIVGTGTFSFDGDPGNGTFALTSLPNFNFNFNVGGSTFTNPNIATPVADVSVIISLSGSDRFVNFGGARSGPFTGSLDFINGANDLSFQPDGGSLYSSNNPNSSLLFGNYTGIAQLAQVSVPEPSSDLGLFVLGCLGVSLLLKRNKA